MTDRKDPFEERLREALRSGSESTEGPGSADDGAELLDRIHRGAARRRTRRRAGGMAATAVLTSALLITLPLLTPPPSTDESAHGPSAGTGPDQPSVSAGAGAPPRPDRRTRTNDLAPTKGESRSVTAGRFRAGVAVEVDDVRVTSVSGANTDEFWVSGYGTCNDDDVCNVLGHSGNGGADLEFTTLPVSGHTRQTTVRFSSDGTTGWATDGGGVFRTDSEGRSWTRLRQPDDVRVSDLDVWEDEVWAVGSRPTSKETVVLASHRDSDELVKVRESRLEPVDAVALGSRTFGVSRVDPELNFSRTSDGGTEWTDGEIGCEPADLSAVDDATWVLCTDLHAVVRSTNQGSDWLPPETLDSAVYEAPTKIAAIDADTAFVAGSDGGWVVEGQQATPADGIAAGPYAYADFSTEDVGYLIGNDGHLCRTDDGGYTWEPVELP